MAELENDISNLPFVGTSSLERLVNLRHTILSVVAYRKVVVSYPSLRHLAAHLDIDVVGRIDVAVFV
jgi:hypothetical protein